MAKVIIDPKEVEAFRLPNGLQVEFWDYSRRVAGDRWLVGLLVKIPIEVYESDFAHLDDPAGLYAEFVQENGGNIIYFQVEKERNFIDEREKDQVFASLLDSLKKHALAYMGHDAFASGVKKKRIEEFLERRNWWKETG